ncbi:ferrochelatase [Dysgonomonas sp. 25]|uniref:ferrochelatase n=1 Tax=Dysgonomonas sp. 25 TaxID=2302933 RepID=UPI0013D33351|nr:ferrochelatase [Dysgonomonas sp. 25]NDV69095.1 ferrochelatase [Dysgonomonas sp. 25]
MQGILLVNTGSPRSKHRKDVAAFVTAMLSDPLLMTVPDWFRPILVKGLIVPFRQFASARKYSLIWDEEHHAAPLLYHMQQLAAKLEKRTEMPVRVAMRYGEPDIASALKSFEEAGSDIHEVIVVPLFPQYAESSYQTTVDEIGRIFMDKPYPFRLNFIKPYYSHPAYIEALCSSLSPFLQKRYDMLLFNYHSLPLSHVEKGWKKGKEFDYVYQLKETVMLVQKQLGLDMLHNRIVFSSAVGSKWLQPFLDETMKEIASEGVKDILIVSPGFACDNLETLYDIKIAAREIFLRNGGKSLTYVPCLNSEDYWIDGLIKIITQ